MSWRVAKGWKVRDGVGVLRRGGEEVSLPEGELKKLEKRGVVEQLHGHNEAEEIEREEVTSDGAAVSEPNGGVPDPEKSEPGNGKARGRKPVAKN